MLDTAPTSTHAVPPLPDTPRATRGVLILLLTTFLWGSTFTITQHTLDGIPAAQLLLGRFALATLVFLPFLRTGRRLWLAAIELGLLLWAGYATQTIGLRYTSVPRSAFITALPVVLVPAFAGLLGRRVGPAVWLAAGLALLGVALLTGDGGRPNRGDAWTLACAVTWAAYITRLETFAKRFPALHITAAHLLVVAVVCAAWVTVSPDPVRRPGPGYPWPAVLYLGLATTAATTWLQAVGQRSVPAAQTAILYTLEPVFATLFALALPPHVHPGPLGDLGGLLILAAALLAQLPTHNLQPPTSDLPYRLIRLLGSPAFRVSSRPLVLHADRLPTTGGYVLAANHHSPYDVPCLMLVHPRPLDFLSIVEMRDKPAVGRLFRLMNCAFLDRRRPDPAAVRQVTAKLLAGRVVALFPESGIRPPHQSVTAGGPFNPGCLRLAQLAACPVVPVVVLNTAAYRRFAAWLPFRHTRFAVAFGHPVTVTSLPDATAELAAAFTRLADELTDAPSDT